MEKSQLIQQIRRIADTLKPFTAFHKTDELVWDGRSYSQATSTRGPDPYAAEWWTVLETMGDLLRYQDGPLSDMQIDYIRRRLLGGMGSFNDFRLNEKELGEEAAEANKLLDQLVDELYTMIKKSQRTLP